MLQVSSTRLVFRIIAIIAILCLAYFLLEPGVDWQAGFRPAALALLKGKNPYLASGSGFFNPPWVMLIFVPLALLPVKLGSLILTSIGFVSYFYISRKLGGDLWATLGLILSPAVALDLAYANITWLVILGYLMPPQIGLFFVMLKPQVGLGVAIYWFVDAVRKGGVRELVRIFAPVTLAYALSFLIFGNWLLAPQNLIRTYGGNTSLWPFSILIGGVLLGVAILQSRINLAYMTGPLFSPYVTLYSWQTVQVGLLPHRWRVILSTVAFWLIYLFAIGIIRFP